MTAPPPGWTSGPTITPGDPGRPRRALGASPSDPLHWVLPLGRTWQSVAAGYVALVALVVWPLGPLAVALGVTGIQAARRTGRHGRGRAWFAVVVGVLSTVAMLGLLVVLLAP